MKIEATVNAADTLRTWEKGRVYDVSPDLGEAMIAAGHARSAATPHSEVVRLLGELGAGLFVTGATDPILETAARQAGLPIKSDRRVARGASDGH